MIDFLLAIVAMSASSGGSEQGVQPLPPLNEPEVAALPPLDLDTTEEAPTALPPLDLSGVPQADTGDAVAPLPPLDLGSTQAAPAVAPLPPLVTESSNVEPQVRTGQFTTALEVKPILTATKAQWMAIREYDGQDLVYVTHLWAWRCGLTRIEISFNNGAWQDWPLPPCHLGTASPNAITEEDGLPYISGALGSVAALSVRVHYDDGTQDEAAYARTQILMP